MFCKNCGAEIKNNAFVCINCGAQVAERFVSTFPSFDKSGFSKSEGTPVSGSDIMIESIAPSGEVDGTFDIVFGVTGEEIGEAAKLADALGVVGSSMLDGEFSSDGMDVNLQRTTDGKVKAIVTPDGAPNSFFLRVKIK